MCSTVIAVDHSPYRWVSDLQQYDRTHGELQGCVDGESIYALSFAYILFSGCLYAHGVGAAACEKALEAVFLKTSSSTHIWTPRPANTGRTGFEDTQVLLRVFLLSPAHRRW